MIKRWIIYWFLGLMPLSLFAQDEDAGFNPDGPVPQTSAFRLFLSGFSFNFQLGYGRTFYHHDVPGLAVFRSNDEIYLSAADNPGLNSTVNAYQYWMNDPQLTTREFGSSDQYLSSDTVTYRMVGTGSNYPLTLSLHYTILEKFRIGGGATFEFHSLNKVGLKKASDSLGIYNSNYNLATFKRYFGYAGYKFWSYKGWSYVGELKVGAQKLGKHYQNALVSKSIFFEPGISFERGLSEYFRVTVKPSVEFRNYVVSVPGLDTPIKHKLRTPYLNVGVSYSIPPLKRCPIKSCHTQINHVHQGKEYRSRRHPFFKKQNPNYGENYPQLQIYKPKNRGKL